MIRNKRVYSIITLVSLITAPVLAIGWDIGGSTGAFLSIPGSIQEDAVPPLSSGYFSFSYSPLVIQSSANTHLSFLTQITHTTRSQLYGPIYFKDFTTLATGLEFELSILHPISFSLALLFSLQIEDDERGSFGYLITRGSFIIPLTNKETPSTLFAIFPIDVEIRSDYTGLRIGAGVKYRYMRESL